MTTANKGVVVVDSGSESDYSPPKQKRTSRRNKRQHTQKAAQTVRKLRSSKQLKETHLVIDDNDDSLIIEEDSFSNRNILSSEKFSNGVIEVADGDDNSDTLSSEKFSNSVIEVGETEDNSDFLRTTETIEDVSPTENILPSVSQPRKITKRGLAKKRCEPSSDSSVLLSHNVSVYSQAVAAGFKNFMQSVDPEEAAVDVPREIVATEAKEMNADLSGRDIDSSKLREAQIVSILDQSDLGDADEEIVSSVQLLSPSPPPQATVKRAMRMNKKLTSAFKALNKAKTSLEQKTPPSKRHQKRNSDVIIVGEETCVQKDIIVKVRYLTNVYRIHMKPNEPFHVLTNKLSKEIVEAEHKLGLFLHDRSLEVSATPQSVHLSVADIIECHCIKVSEDSICSSDAIQLVIQCINSKSKITISANKRRPLSDVMQKYAQLKNGDVDSFMFSFDGEDIDPSDTPSKLEMEDQDIIDVVHN